MGIRSHLFTVAAVTSLGLTLLGCSELPIDISTPGDRKAFRFGEDNILWVTWDYQRLENTRYRDAEIKWVSSVDGALGPGFELNTSALSAGDHVITAEVTHEGEHYGHIDGYIRITILNDAPEVSIIQPSSVVHYQGDPLRLFGEGTDREDGALPGERLSWRVDGSLEGVGAELTLIDVALGEHDLELTATDLAGLTRSARFRILVVPRGGVLPPSNPAPSPVPSPGASPSASPAPSGGSGAAGRLGGV